MTGLEKLLSEIQDLAGKEADQVLRSAESEVAKIEEANRERIKLRTEEILAKAETAAKSLSERGLSNRKIQQRNEILTLKQELLRATVKKAKQKVASLSDQEYFGLLKSWASRAGIPGKAVVCLNEKDLARNKGDFLESFLKGADASLSEKPVNISGGFLAVCGGITINCSIDSVFEIHADEIQGEIQRILFD